MVKLPQQNQSNDWVMNFGFCGVHGLKLSFKGANLFFFLRETINHFAWEFVGLLIWRLGQVGCFTGQEFPRSNNR